MARPEIIKIPIDNSDGNDGNERKVDRFRNKWLQFEDVNGGSFDVELAIGSVFVSVLTITTNGFFEIPQTADSVRIHTTTASGGTPVATIMGFDERVHG